MWRVMGSSVEGVLHAENGRGCEDAHGWRRSGETTVVAIADGAGSRPITSALGSHAVVAAALKLAGEHDFAGDFLEDPGAVSGELLAEVRDALASTAKAHDLEEGQLATTLAVGVLRNDRVAVAQIGDGIVVVGGPDRSVELVARADRFEYANQTVFVTTEGAEDHVKIFSSTGIDGLAMSTDGLRYKILDDVSEARPFAAFFTDAWGFARTASASSEAIGGFLRGVDDQTGDDKTLLLAVSGYDGDDSELSGMSDPPEIRSDEAVDSTDSGSTTGLLR